MRQSCVCRKILDKKTCRAIIKIYKKTWQADFLNFVCAAAFGCKYGGSAYEE